MEPSPATRPARRSRAPLRRRMFLAIVAFGAAVVALELLLQVGALVVHWVRPAAAPAPTPSAGDEVVLCVGDSWTHGMGASDHTRFSYPAVLQELLRERTGRPWRVANGGQSGQDSRDVLLRLPAQLAGEKPRLVCVLIGRNDYWSRPERVDDGAVDEAADGYRFRWRVPRLLAWALRSKPVEPAAGGPRGPEWAPRRIEWTNAYPAEPWPWASTPEGRANRELGWQRFGAGDLTGAAAAFEAILAGGHEDPQARQCLATILHRQGRPADAEPHLAWLAGAWQRDGNYWVGKSLVTALGNCGKSAELIEVAAVFVKRWPKESTIWWLKAQAEQLLGRYDEAQASIDICLQDHHGPWAHGVRYKVLKDGRHDLPGAVRAVFDGYRHHNDADWAAGWLTELLEDPRFDAGLLRTSLAVFEAPADVSARLAVLVEEAMAARDGAAARAVLEHHLRRIIAQCRAAGAQPVFLDYPIPTVFAAVLRDVAATAGIPFVDTQRRFTAKLGGRDPKTLRSPDGHVDDEGYRLMAEAIADGLLEAAVIGR